MSTEPNLVENPVTTEIENSVYAEEVVKKPRAFKTVMSETLNGFLIIILSLIAVMTSVVIFFSTVAEDLSIRPAFGFSRETIGDFLTSIYPLLFCSALLVIFLLLLILKNRKPVRKVFLSIGIAACLSGIIYILAGLFSPILMNYLPMEVRDIILGTTSALRNLLFVSALACFVVFSLFISIFRIIKYVKREA